MNKRRNFTSKFKTKVVLEALSERYTISVDNMYNFVVIFVSKL